MLIPKNTSVLIRRVPGRPRMPIVTAPITELEEYCLDPFNFVYSFNFLMVNICENKVGGKQMSNYCNCLKAKAHLFWWFVEPLGGALSF